MPAPLVDIGYSQWVAIVKDDSVNFKGPNVLGQSSSAPGVMQNDQGGPGRPVYIVLKFPSVSKTWMRLLARSAT